MISRRCSLLGMIAAGTLFATGCHITQGIQGDGVAKTETRPVEVLHAIDIQTILQAEVTVGGDGGKSVEISGDSNLVPLVTSEIKDGTLTLGLKSGTTVRTKLPLKVVIAAKTLDRANASDAARVNVTWKDTQTPTETLALDASGTARVEARGFATTTLSLDARGSSTIEAEGAARIVQADADGASTINAPEVAAEEVTLSISGASHAEIKASKSVKGDISGASNASVHGDPATREVGTSGTSRVDYGSGK